MNSKLLRSELKSIVKECLVEILSEGLENNLSYEKSNQVQKRVQESKKNVGRAQRGSHLDNIHYGKKKSNIKNLKTNLTENPVLNDILADTAISTLTEQASAESRRGSASIAAQGDTAAKTVDRASPEELFGGVSDKWASLAFS